MKGKMMSEHTAGMVVGSLFGIMHAVWTLLVASGFAQTYLNWIFGLHFLSNPFIVAPFDFGTAALLVIVTSLIGYVVGWVLAVLWNMTAKKK